MSLKMCIFTNRQASKANDLLTELNTKRNETEALKMNLQKQEQDKMRMLDRIKELEQGYVGVQCSCK